MKIAPSLLLIIVLFSCTAPKKNDENKSDDSLAAASQPVTADNNQPQAEASPTRAPLGGALPDWDTNPLFDNSSEEQRYIAAVDSILSKAQTYSYLTVTMKSDTAYMSGDNESDYNEERQVENVIYLDSSYRLRGYSREFYTQGMGEPNRRLQIYVFQKDSLIAGYENSKHGWPDQTTDRIWIAPFLCPACALNLRQVNEDEPTAQKDVARAMVNVRKGITRDIAIIASSIRRTWRDRKKGDNENEYKLRVDLPIRTIEGYSGEEVFTAWFSLKEDVYNSYIKNVPPPEPKK